MLLYLDTCALNRPFDEQNDSRIIEETDAILQVLSEVTKNKNRLAWSYVLDIETIANPHIIKRARVLRLRKYHSIFQVEADDVVLLANTHQKLGFDESDALHLACAIKLRCDYFITTDKGILNKKKKIAKVKIINPIDFMIETEKRL